MLAELERDSLLPCILFRSSRKQCDEDIERLTDSNIGMVPAQWRKELRSDIDEIIKRYGISENVVTGHPHYSALISTAAGAHHAGQLLQWRLVLEELMTKGKLRIMVATGTVAAGVDFPARSVVITAHSRRGQDGFQTLLSSELQQMSGRAGRRGKDAVGICLVAPGHFCDARIVHDLSRRPPEPLRSAYFAAPSSVLNLLKYRSVDDLKFTVERSLASYRDRKGAETYRGDAAHMEKELEGQESELSNEAVKKIQKRIRRKYRDADLLEQHQLTQLESSLEGLAALGHFSGQTLTEKGTWSAELCTNLVLHLAEAIDRGVFYNVEAPELAAMIGSIAGDSHRTYLTIAKNPIPKDVYGELEQIVKDVREKYHGPSNAKEVEVVPDAALTVYTWFFSDSWTNFASLLKLGGVAEGDAARLITQTADHLQQICGLFETHPDLARTAAEARTALLRPPLSENLIID